MVWKKWCPFTSWHPFFRVKKDSTYCANNISMASVLDLVKHYQHAIEKYCNDEQKILKSIDKLFHLDVTVQHLQETGVGRTVNALRKEPGDVGQAARALVYKWKLMVAAEESDQDGDRNNDTATYNGHENGRDSDDNAKHQSKRADYMEKSNISVKTEHKTNGDHSGSKRKYHSSEDEEPDSKKKKSSSNRDNKNNVTIKKEASESYSDDSDQSYSDDSDSDISESEDERNIKKEIKTEPPDNFNTKQLSKNHTELKTEPSNSKKSNESEKHSKSSHQSESSEKKSEKSSTKEASHSSHKHKSSKEKESHEKSSKSKHNSSEKDKREKVDSSSSKHRSSSKHKSSNSESSDKPKSSSDKHSSRSDKSRSSSSSHKSDKEKHKSSEKDVSEKHKAKDDSRSSKDKHSSSNKEKSKEKSSSSKEKSDSHKGEKKQSSSDKSKHSDSKHKSDRKDEKSSEKKSKHSSSSSSSKSKSSSSKSKEEVPKKKVQLSATDSDDGIDCGSGASFAEALGMITPAKPKKKDKTSLKDSISPNTSNNNDLSPAALLAPTAKLAPLPALEISALPEISPNYKPRPPPKLLPHFSDEEAMSAVISSKNQRTKVYSGNKVIGKIPTLYEMCVQILQEHIDALEYTGGVPYDILKPVVDKASPPQLFMLEHFNPYLMDDTDHLWQKFCEKNFRNKQRQEMETWREMYMRCQEEQEHRLKSLTANIKIAQEAKKAPIKQTKMAYVDSIVKPPRNVARKQALHGTAHAASASPAARVASLAAAPNVLRGNVRPTPSGSISTFQKPKKAPLMQKALQFMRGRKR